MIKLLTDEELEFALINHGLINVHETLSRAKINQMKAVAKSATLSTLRQVVEKLNHIRSHPDFRFQFLSYLTSLESEIERLEKE